MGRILHLLILLSILLSKGVFAQDSLSRLSVKNKWGHIVLQWHIDHPGNITTIKVQRSADSLRNFNTVGVATYRQMKATEFEDPKPPNDSMYYRIFIAFEGGDYVFSNVTRPVKRLSRYDKVMPVKTIAVVKPVLPLKTVKQDTVMAQPVAEWTKKPDYHFSTLPEKKLLSERFKKLVHYVELKAKYPSNYVYTGKDNNVLVSLPGALTKKYLIRFFDSYGKMLFELTKLPEEKLVIEKVNFMHSGWFYFELYENGRLVEKNKFNIAAE